MRPKQATVPVHNLSWPFVRRRGGAPVRRKHYALNSAVAGQCHDITRHPIHGPGVTYNDAAAQTPPHVYNALRDKFYVTRHLAQGVIVTYYEDENAPPAVVANRPKVFAPSDPTTVSSRVPSRVPSTIRRYARPAGASRIAPVPSNRPPNHPEMGSSPAARPQVKRVCPPSAPLSLKRPQDLWSRIAKQFRAALKRSFTENIEKERRIVGTDCLRQRYQRPQVDRYQGFDPNQLRDRQGRWTKVDVAGGANQSGSRKCVTRAVERSKAKVRTHRPIRRSVGKSDKSDSANTPRLQAVFERFKALHPNQFAYAKHIKLVEESPT